MDRSEKLKNYTMAAGVMAASAGSATGAVFYSNEEVSVTLDQNTEGTGSAAMYLSLSGASTFSTGAPEELQFALATQRDLAFNVLNFKDDLDASIVADVGIGTVDISPSETVDASLSSGFGGGTLAAVEEGNTSALDIFSGRIAFRLDADGSGPGTDYHYGWADVEARAQAIEDVGASATLTIREVAIGQTPNGGLALGAIPEPGIVSLLALAGGGLFLRRRRDQES